MMKNKELYRKVRIDLRLQLLERCLTGPQFLSIHVFDQKLNLLGHLIELETKIIKFIFRLYVYPCRIIAPLNPLNAGNELHQRTLYVAIKQERPPTAANNQQRR